MNPFFELPFGTHKKAYIDIDPREALALTRRGVRVVDVREVHEFDGDLGHVPGAELHPLSEWPTVVLEWPKDEPIVLVCRSGGRSGRAADTLAANGFAQVYNVVGGMMAWSGQGLPVERGS
jgi:rhodanese-related sulfurtransferase